MPEDLIRRLIGNVLVEALRWSGRTGIVLLDDDSPEADLLAKWCIQQLGPARFWRVRGSTRDSEAEESPRHEARAVARSRQALTAHAANKSALLLSAEPPPEPLLPLGDLYASQVQALAGAWDGPADMKRLVDQAGGIQNVDRALLAWLEGWQAPECALAGLPAESRGPFLEAVRRGRFWRERAGLVPKLSQRTIGVDLFL